MNCERRLFILSLVLCVGLVSNVAAQTKSVTENCVSDFTSDGVWAGFNAETVDIEVTHPLGGTNPVRVSTNETFCTEADRDFNPGQDVKDTCERNGFWTFAIGDDFPLDGLGNPALGECSYTVGPGAFPLSTVADMSGGTEFCMVITNLDDNEVSLWIDLVSSVGNAGIALQIRTFSESEQVWLGDASDKIENKSKTVCLDFDNARVQPSFAPGQNVPNLENVTGFAIQAGANAPFTERRKECWDNDGDNDPGDCLNGKPPGCTENSCKDGNYQNRESDNVLIDVEQPRPMMAIVSRPGTYCNGGFGVIRINNPGTGTLFITEVELTGTGASDFDATISLPFAVPRAETASFVVRYNPRDVGRQDATLRFKTTNALDIDNNPIVTTDPAFLTNLTGFSTVVQMLTTDQVSATRFIARTVLNLHEDIDTGFQPNGEDDGLVPTGCGRVEQINSVSSRWSYDPTKIIPLEVKIGRPTDEPNGAVSGVETTDLAPLPCCVTDNSDLPLNEGVEWQIIYNTPFDDANAQGELDIVAGDIGGVILDTSGYVNSFPLTGSPRRVQVECFSGEFELLSLTGCNTASVSFTRGTSDNFFPDNHQSNIGVNPPGLGTAELQDVGANSAQSLGIPENSFVRGDVDFSAQANANDIVRTADVIFNTDGSQAQVEARIGRKCVAAVDLTNDKSIDIRDLLTLIQLLFNITSNIQAQDVPKLQPFQVSKASDLPGATVEWPGAGYQVQVPNNDTSADDVKDDPNHFTCEEGLDCPNA